MKTSSLIGHVAELHNAVMQARKPADRMAAGFFSERKYLGSRERRFIAETLYGMLRQERLLEVLSRSAFAQAGGAGHDPVPSLALYAVYALRFLHTPPEGVLEDLGALWEAFVRVPSAPAFLRAAAVTPVPELSRPADRLALHHSMPVFLTEEWVDRWGEEEAGALCAALNTAAPTVIRANTLRGDRSACREALGREGLTAEPTPLSPTGLRIDRRFHAESLAAFRAGLFELQDEASQLAGYLSAAAPGERVLDFCAGGGGKTLHLAALMENRGELIARDISAARLGDIRRRLLRAGAEIVRTPAPGDTGLRDLAEASMDLVFVDAPCSGAGTFRRNPAAKLFLTPDACRRYESLQAAILRDAARYVRPGGRLVYCTCTLRRRENEGIIEDFHAGNGDFRVLPAEPILAAAGVSLPMETPYLLLTPHRHGTDGFFGAVLRRS